ncbi:MAG: PKD domain-containing protein, partial [Bacteroidota bacterium]
NQCLVGNNFIFSDTSSILTGTITRLWSFGNGDTSTAINPTKSYSSANSYSVKLLETSDNGCMDSVIKTVNVNPKPSVGFTINNTSQCVNDNNFLFTDTTIINSGTITRQWNFGTGINDTSTSNNPNKVYTSTNTYSVKLFVNSNNGCKDSLTKTLTVNPKPIVGFTINNAAQCLSGNSFVLNDTSSISSGTITRQWSFGTGINDTSSSSNPNKVYTTANTYSVKLISTSNNGCKDSLTKTVTVNPKPIVGFTQNFLAQCLSENNFILNDTSTISSGTLDRLWDFGNATTSSSTNPNKNYSTAGTYQITLVATSNNNCKDSITKTVTVYAQPKSGFTINNTLQCLVENSFSFDDTTYSSTTRLWDLGDLTKNTNDTFSKIYSNAGTYIIKLKVNDAHNCSDSSTKTITVKQSPAKPMVNAITNSLLQSTVANSYQWYLNNSIISSATNQTLAITTNGNYFVLIDSTNGCSNLSNLFAASSVGIVVLNISQNEIKIYPNPATQELFISFLSPQNTNTILIEVIDVKGSKLMSFNETIQTGKPLSIDINYLAAGMYFVMVNNKAYKFIKTDK